MTLKTYPGYASMTTSRRRKLAALFGVLEIKYTPKYVHTVMGESKERSPYKVLGEDANSIVVQFGPKKFKKELEEASFKVFAEILDDQTLIGPKIHHIHFQRLKKHDLYWISGSLPLTGLVFTEWFRRIQ